MSSGVKMRPSKVLKSGTTSTKNHRFESFTQRIAKLKIDPVRRVRRHGLEDEDLSATTSYFKDSLERWVDLNLSENFTDFARSAKPLCESLPQLLHYQDRVMGMLAEYIGKMDALSLEPLLSLLGHFAHDLGAQFEPHFPATVDLVASVAAKHPDVEVIEWAFTCLAWLFKYLSRLLVPDLRPLYEILAPLLGREHQKLFIVRFAAEALSFLVRKAGALYFKNKTPLEIIIQHAFEDLRKTAETRDVQFYQRGLMTLFASSVKGVKRGLHSSGVAVIRSLLNNITKEDRSYGSWAKEVFCGVLINLIHHTDADGFKEIMEAVLDGVQDISLHPRPGTLAFGGRLLFIMASVRKGSRIQDWQPMLEKLKHLLTSTTILSHAAVDDVAAHILPAAATILQSSPLDIILPHLREIMQIITDERLQEHFLTFCDYFAQMESERFRSFLLPELQR